MPDFLPRKDVELLAWSRNFAERISVDPPALGISIEQALAYESLNLDYANAYRRATEPITRGPLNVRLKDEAKAEVVAYARVLARIIQATPGVGDAEKALLGLTVRKGRGTKIEAPTEPPTVRILDTKARTITAQIVNKTELTRTGRPEGVAGAQVYSYVGEEPPEDLRGWTREADVTRTRFELTLPLGTPRGSKVYLAVCWYTTRALRGPMSQPVCTLIAGGGLGTPSHLKQAA